MTIELSQRETLRLRSRAWRAKHPERSRAINRASYEAHAEERRAYRKAYVQSHQEEVRAKKKVDYEMNRTKILARQSIWVSTHSQSIRANNLKRLYGLMPEEFDALLAKQDGKCAICGTSNWNGRGPHVDHDHITGKIRGILCHNCNTGSGMLKDDPEIINKLLAYVQQ